jgi:tRNA 2-thiouridine synthesizing protein A
MIPWFRRSRRNNQRMYGKHATDSPSFEVDLPGVGRLIVARKVDCVGDGCPKPQLLTLKALNQVAVGDVVELVSDNPTAVETIPALMMAVYGSHIATVRGEGCWKVYVRKGI